VSRDLQHNLIKISSTWFSNCDDTTQKSTLFNYLENVRQIGKGFSALSLCFTILYSFSPPKKHFPYLARYASVTLEMRLGNCRSSCEVSGVVVQF
jgi:hypothetical protein